MAISCSGLTLTGTAIGMLMMTTWLIPTTTAEWLNKVRIYFNMENNNLYFQVYNLSNLILAWRKARKGKTRKEYVIEFEKDLIKNLLKLQEELREQTYFSQPLKTFILRDPKTRKISKSEFRDRIVHHALVRVIEPDFDKAFIYDSCANRKGKGNLFALERFCLFKRKVTNNLKTEAYCLKADIKHYFEEVDHEILIKIIQRKINDEKVIWLIEQILNNTPNRFGGGANEFLLRKECLSAT